MKKLVLLALGGLVLTGCSNWALKAQCEKTNWFEYARDVAFKGKFLEEDRFVQQCRAEDKVSATQIDQGFKSGREKMCNYDEVNRRARQGMTFNFQFCDGLNMPKMKSAYDQGLKVFCVADSGYQYGRSGQVYQNVCSAETERVFMPPYQKGRREHLTELIKSLDTQIADLNIAIEDRSKSEGRYSREISSLPSPQECRRTDVYDEATKTNVSRLVCEEASYIRSQRSSLQSNLSDLRSELRQLREKHQLAMTQKAEAQKSLTQLPE